MSNLMNLEQAVERVKEARKARRKAWIVSMPKKDKDAFVEAVRRLHYGLEIEQSGLNPDRLTIYGHCVYDSRMTYLDALSDCEDDCE